MASPALKRCVLGAIILCALWLVSSRGPPRSSLGFAALAPQNFSSSFISEMPSPIVPATPYTAAVVYLLTTLPDRRPKDSIFRSLSLLQKNVPWRYEWPILLFHAGPYDTDVGQAAFLDKLRITAAANNLTAQDTETLLKRIEFIHVGHTLPQGIPADPKEYKPVWLDMWPGYHHMCAFYSYKIFSHPRVKDLTFYFRLDDDSFIREPVCFDPIEYLHAAKKSFAFRAEGTDWQGVTAGMWPFVSNYAVRYPEVEDRLRGNHWPWAPKRFWPNYGQGLGFPGFGGNFEVVRIARFQTPEVKAFFHELQSDQTRFYHIRWSASFLPWGDFDLFFLGHAPVRKATVYVFLNVTEEVHYMGEVEYGHKKKNYPGRGCTPLP
ncbi:glycolipid 2-alpha-mannosyltransferase-domain-containing protein [Mycena alexandri]|uniref:Glycolipid 2-alpha-mannosyltransferase-domain-containing protein n=1 Tax=Mycena alexandri TaxID=1745969 RepID=A0AAD6T1Z0_9AGAR|nr:glycolipid 2-alpha-mannosyltransferase-domain-containing protein [Mycena alexandri]